MYFCLLRIVFFAVCLTLPLSSPLSANPLLIEGLASLDALNSESDVDLPNPIKLHPQWWNYFNAEGDELNRRITATNESLQKLYLLLPAQDQNASLTLINKILSALNALPYARKQELPPANIRPFLTTYTLQKQLEINKDLRKLREEIKLEGGRLDLLKDRLSKTQKHVDNLMVNYLAQSQPSTAKLMNGLEIMLHGANAAVGEQKVRAATALYDALLDKEKKLKEELEYSKSHLDLHEFNEAEMEKNIAVLKQDLEKSQDELSRVESHLLVSFNDIGNDHSQQLFLEQQLLHALANRAYAWAYLAFASFEFNLLMYLNDRFDGHEELRKNLSVWEEKVEEIEQQAEQWENASRIEQDRIRQEYTALAAQNEPADSKLMKNNRYQRQEVLNFLTTVELIKDKVADTEWLIHMLDVHFRNNSSWIENWWNSISEFFGRQWDHAVDLMNFSLFKISGIPITLASILKLVMIFAIAMWMAAKISQLIIRIGKRNSEFSESTLHIFGGLARYFVLSIGFILSLWSIGIDFSHLIFIIGALLFGISFGFQSIANNIFCGLRILFERKLQLGDDIELHSGHHGKVEEIHIQNTIVCTSDGQKVIIPNSEIIGNTLINWTRKSVDYRRLHIPFSVTAENDKDLVRDVVIEAAKKVPCTLRDSLEYSEPQVWLVNFDHHVLNFKLVVWVDYDHEACTDSKESDFLWEIETALRENRISLPSTLYDLLSHNIKHAHAH